MVCQWDEATAAAPRRGGAGAGPVGQPLVVVTGKGGVGKSTVAAALGLTAARRGLRTIIAEVARRDDVSRVLGGTGVHEDALAPGGAPPPLLPPARGRGGSV